MRILYAGDSPVGGAANYLVGILNFLKADFVHIPPGKTLAPSLLKKRCDAIVLSDFSRHDTPPASQKRIAGQVGGGTGLLMVGGWGSFGFGGWRGSLVEKLLPVSCRPGDDRVNLPGGAWIVQERKHAMFRGISFKDPPVICGLNRIRPKKGTQLILTARAPSLSPLPLRGRGLRVRGSRAGLPFGPAVRRAVGNLPYGRKLERMRNYPLLVVDSNPHQRIAALATDLAPHWSGGLIDWGTKRVKIRVKGKFSVEVGDLYVQFVSALLKWLVRR